MAVLGLVLAGTGARAGSASLDLVIRVVSSSGACGTSVAGGAVSVSCGSFASLPVVAPVSGSLAPQVVRPFVSSSFASVAPPFVPAGILVETLPAPAVAPSPSVTPGAIQPPTGTIPEQLAPPPAGAPDRDRRDRDPSEQPAQDDAPPAQQLALAPLSGPDNSPTTVYGKSDNLSSWRVVSNDNVQHVQLTIAW